MMGLSDLEKQGGLHKDISAVLNEYFKHTIQYVAYLRLRPVTCYNVLVPVTAII